MTKCECSVQTGEAAQDSSFHPLNSHCALPDSSAWGDNSGVINVTFPPADISSFCPSAATFFISTALPTGGRQVSCGDTLFAELQNKAVSEDLGIVFTSASTRIFASLFNSAHSHCHMPGIPLLNFILQTSGGKNTLPEPLTAIAPSCFFGHIRD